MRKDTKLLCIQNTDCFSCHLNKDGRRGRDAFRAREGGGSEDAKRKLGFFLHPRNNAKVGGNLLV